MAIRPNGQSRSNGKVLNQTTVTANTDTTLYTVPSGRRGAGNIFVTVTNRDTSNSATYRVAIRPAGAVLANQHYVVYDRTIAAADFHVIPIGDLEPTDVVTVRSSDADVGFQANGEEYD